MAGDFQSTRRRLTDGQIDSYRRQARKTLLGGGYNLFAEITLQMIENYYVRIAEMENISRVRVDREREVELLAHENQTLRDQVISLEDEKLQLLQHIEQQRQEIDRLQANRFDVPPARE